LTTTKCNYAAPETGPVDLGKFVRDLFANAGEAAIQKRATKKALIKLAAEEKPLPKGSRG
jgi:hypothetical protein